MNKLSSLPFSELFEKFVSFYLREYGEKKAKEISDKVNNSNKSNLLIREANDLKLKLGTEDFVGTILSSTSFSFSKAETICLASILLLFRWDIEVCTPNQIADQSYLNSIFFRIIDKCDTFKIHTSGNKNFFEKFYVHLNSHLGLVTPILNDKNYSSDSIKILINENYLKLIDIISKTKDYKTIDYDELNGISKQYADEYLKYIAYTIAGAVLICELETIGFDRNSEEFKNVLKTVYQNTLKFVNQFVLNSLIDYREFRIDYREFNNDTKEYIILSQVKTKLEKYADDINHFFKTNAPSYVEKITEDDGDGNFVTHNDFHDYDFISDIHGMRFKELTNSISIVSNYRGFHYHDEHEEERINRTLEVLKSLKK